MDEKYSKWVVIGVIVMMFFVFPPFGIIGAVAYGIYYVVNQQSNQELDKKISDFRQKYGLYDAPSTTREDFEVPYHEARPQGLETPNTIEDGLTGEVMIRPEEGQDEAEVVIGHEEGQEEAVLINSPEEGQEVAEVMIGLEEGQEEAEVMIRPEEGQEDGTKDESDATKAILCPMCGTENQIDRTNRFDSHNCRQCGMLLLIHDDL